MQYRARKKEKVDVTVCIAAICRNNTVLGVSDRMLTAGDIQFEPAQPKIWPLTASIVALYAGDTALLTEILNAVSLEVNHVISADPSTWVAVKEVAEMYRRHFLRARGIRAESSILAPLGLTINSFLAAQAQMSPGLVSSLQNQLQRFELPEPITAIFVGIDHDGPQPTARSRQAVSHAITYPHIYVVRNHEVICQDRVGFAAIGIGTSHAESQFMYSGHTRSNEFVDTILLSYFAKKRAEVAPGVGKETDMFFIGPNVGSYTKMGDHVIAGLENIYKKHEKDMLRANQRSSVRMKKFDEELAKKVGATQQQPPERLDVDAPESGS